jgi:hypothetical protein
VSLLATQQDFEPANPTEGATALWYTPHDGSGHPVTSPAQQARIDWLKATYPPSNQKLAIWGCGWGGLVDLAVTAGYDAWGFDASTYVIPRGKQVHGSVSTRLFQADALNSTQVANTSKSAGIKGQGKFALLITEDMLTCMSDAEVTKTLPYLRSESTVVIHMVSPLDPTAQQDARINWKAATAWKTLVAPDIVYDVVAGSVV